MPGSSKGRTYQVYEGAYTAEDPTRRLPGTEVEEPEVETNRSAVTSLVLGLSIIVPPAGLFAMMFGIIALTQIKESKEREDLAEQKGRGLAIAGITCGAVFQLAWFLLIIMALAGYASILDGVFGR